MARQELKAPLSKLFDEKSKHETSINTIKDKITIKQEQLLVARREKDGYREAKEHLSNTASNKPAINVFNQGIAEAEKKCQDINTELDVLQKDYEVVNSKIKALERSIKELQNA